jgi:hypothetical protein
MALNAPDRPWTVRSGPEADLVVEWKYADATWWGLLAKSGLRKAYRLRLYFDEASHRCGALDEFGEVDWSAGILAAPQVHFSKSFFRGVQLVRMERGVAYGFKTPTGGPGKVLDYSFDINDVKAAGGGCGDRCRLDIPARHLAEAQADLIWLKAHRPRAVMLFYIRP